MALDTQEVEDPSKGRSKYLLIMKLLGSRRPFLTLLVVLVTCTSVIGQQRLLVVGGGARPAEAMKTFVGWSGGNRSRILVITWASNIPEESFEALDRNFQEAGAGIVEQAPVRPLDTVKRARFIEQLNNATGVFFTGGDQNRIMNVLADDQLLQLLKAKYNSGTPFGGTSAGAAVMSDPMITGEADLKALDGKKVGVRKGLGLVPNVIFDQHFLVRQRHNRLFGLIIENPKMLGIGIDEDTAVLIEDNRKLTVSGKTQVMFVHSKNVKGPFLVSFLRANQIFDLSKRKTKH